MSSRPATRNFVSLYGGVGRVAEEAATRGCNSYVFDLSLSPLNDLTKTSVQQDVQLLIDKDSTAAVGIDIVCSTWSRARRAPLESPFPSALRDAEHLFGLPHVTGQDAIRVSQGNRMYYHAVRLIKQLIDLNVPGYLENPLTSMLWLTPGMQRLMRHPQVIVRTTHMCQYGVPWRKATRFLFWCVDADKVDMPLCRMQNGRCSATGKQHLQLSGTSGSAFLTAQSQVYPRKLAALLCCILKL